MSKLSAEAKQAIIDKVLAKDGRTVREIAEAHNIGYSTLQKWLKKIRNDAIVDPIKPTTNSQTLSLSERFQHLMATAALDETAIGIYCRAHGLYAIQLTQWKDTFMTIESTTKKQDNLSELRALRIENKQLKKEVTRKNSALAEATALLILKKKADLIWGEPEDE
jgi:transposase